jgi:hypothetical protein
MTTENLKQIASLLPSGFVVAEDKISLQRADGMNLWFLTRYNTPGKITVKYGNTEKCYVTVYENHNKLDYPSVNVSADKDASKIAKDIVRRLLPDAEKVHKLVLEKVAAEKAHVDGKTKTICDLASFCDTAPNRRHSNNQLSGEVSPYEGIKQFSCKTARMVVGMQVVAPIVLPVICAKNAPCTIKIWKNNEQNRPLPV